MSATVWTGAGGGRSGLRIEVPEAEKFDLVERAVARFSARHEVVAVDGVRVLFGDGWGLVRAANTQPVIVAGYEAQTAERLAPRSET